MLTSSASEVFEQGQEDLEVHGVAPALVQSSPGVLWSYSWEYINH